MVVGWHRDTWIEVDLTRIKKNIQNEQKRLPENTSIWAVVKANAYGHGIIEVAKAAKEAGATGFCVAILDEALALRENGFLDMPILVLGAVRKEDVALAAKFQISITLFDLNWLEDLVFDGNLNIHLKVDTGMGRLGVRSKEEVVKAIHQVKNDHRLSLEGIFTHFATADQKDMSYFNKQIQRFDEILQTLDKKPRYVHVANSADSLLHEHLECNVVRFGIAMYGLTPSTEIADILPFKLAPALSLYTKMVQVKKLKKGDHVSYGATYTAKNEEWIATLPIGYADGIIRHYSGFHVLINGIKAEIIGRVCMDQITIRLPYEFPVGTVVTIIGESSGVQVSADDIADHLNTINYEVICMLSERLKRIYQTSEQKDEFHPI
ncbi:alanine racemase [Listeria sp. PSOL-1]|uniref:alanine racemase n=1 Tax=Listeria sp. PSOL-1 TaxID=1844999 RepID=UPI0013D60C3C|nr:alanine racemase [Listeria sp. PSOL-1]